MNFDFQKLLESAQPWLKKLETLEIWQVCALIFGLIIALAIIAGILRGIFLGIYGLFKSGSSKRRRRSQFDNSAGDSVVVSHHDAEDISDSDIRSVEPKTKKTDSVIQQITITSTEQAIEFIEKLGGRVGKNKQEQIVLIFLNNTRITDEQLKILRYLRNVESLHLRKTRITDKAFAELVNLSHLRFLFVTETAVTPEGIAAFQTKRPSVKVER